MKVKDIDVPNKASPLGLMLMEKVGAVVYFLSIFGAINVSVFQIM